MVSPPASAARAAEVETTTAAAQRARANGGGKNKGKENHTATPDGKPICFRFNDNRKKCSGKKCRFVHVCSLCLGKHPAYQCKGPAKGADTQGEALGQ